MATGGNNIAIYVKADTEGIRRGLASATRDLQRFDRTGTRSVRNVDRASTKLGQTFRSAATYAASAAGAYLSIQQAQVAVETTFELNKATRTLAGNFGMSTKMASQFAAVAKAKGVDVLSLNMAFKTLSTQVMNAKEGTGAAADMFNKLGLSANQLKGMNMDQTIMAVTEALGKMKASGDKGAIMSQLLGRGFSRLGFLFRGGKAGLKDYMKSADKFGASMNQLTSDQLYKAQRAMLDLKLAQLGLYQSLTVALSPAIEFAAKKMSEFAVILNNPKLSVGQKFSQIGNNIQKMFESIDWNKVGNAIASGVTALVPVITMIATKISAPLTEGFVAASPKMLIGIVKGLIAGFPQLVSSLSTLATMGGSVFVKQLGSAIGDRIKGAFSGVGAGFKTIGSGARAAGKLIGSAFKSAFNTVKSTAVGIWNAMGNAFDKVKSGVNSVKGLFVSAFNTIKGVIQDVSNTLSGLKDTITGLPSKVRSLLGFQRGGLIPGSGSGDKIPALLEPGEFVMNRQAVNAVGVNSLSAINRAIPRFKTGGAVKRGDDARLQAALAAAELTDRLTDDDRALQNLETFWRSRETFLMTHKTAGKKGHKKRDWQALAEARQNIKNYRDQRANLYGESGGSLNDTNDLLQQLVESNQRYTVSQSQYGVLIRALSAAVSGQIGGSVGRALQTPSTAGRLASY